MLRSIRYSASAGITSASAAPNHAPGRPAALSASALSERINAIVGMLEKLDPHSDYSDPEETKELTEPLDSNFDGIGIQFNMLTDTLYVIQVISGGPSEKVELMAGDRIIMIDDSLIALTDRKSVV